MAQRFGAVLRRHLDSQPTDGFVLARVVRSSDIEALPGAYRWLVRYDPEHRTVLYVSDDYFTYPAPLRWFAITPDLLARLPRRKIGPHMHIEPRFVSHAEGQDPPTLRMRPSMPDDDTDFE